VSPSKRSHCWRKRCGWRDVEWLTLYLKTTLQRVAYWRVKALSWGLLLAMGVTAWAMQITS
jgi:hypothetical protein